MSCFCGHVEGLESYRGMRCLGVPNSLKTPPMCIYIYIHTHIMFVYTCELLVHIICIQCISVNPIC